VGKIALSRNPRNVLGEREDIVGTRTQGGARGDGGPEGTAVRRGRRSRSSCLALALGYNPPPRWGSMLKKRPPAASQMSNLQRHLEVTHEWAGRSRKALLVLKFQRGNFPFH